jgi:hypothetical protein
MDIIRQHLIISPRSENPHPFADRPFSQTSAKFNYFREKSKPKL